MLAVERYLQLLEHGGGGAQLVHGAQQIELESRSAQPGGGVVLGVVLGVALGVAVVVTVGVGVGWRSGWGKE